MAFGKTEDGAPPECAKKACAIQWCLAKRDKKQELCKDFINDWKRCRDKYMAIYEAEKKRKNQEQQ